MIYIYPKFTKYELPGIRFGGAGLGNLLFLWARAITAAEQHGCTLVWPTWPSIKLGPWLRHEPDKRFYGDLFHSNAHAVCGFRKYMILTVHRKIRCKRYEEINWNDLRNGDVVICDGYGQDFGKLQMNFDGLREYHSLISDTIKSSLAAKGRKALDFDASKAINIHVRMGDFSKNPQGLAQGNNNTRIQIGWYAAMAEKIRAAAGWPVPVNVFSDGTDSELSDLLKLQDVRRVFFGNSIADIVALSKAPVMIASGSSFSLWARFLGRCSSVSYPKQMKDRVLQAGEGFETELSENGDFSEDVRQFIHDAYRQ